MGFTVYKCGIVVYAPERIENPDCYIEAVAIGEKVIFIQQDSSGMVEKRRKFYP